MPKLEYFIVSESVSVDQQTNRASLFNILDEVRENQFPTTIPQAVVTSVWDYEVGDENIDYQVKVRVYLPSGENLKDVPMNVRIEPNNRHRLLLHLLNLQIEQPGELKFKIFLNDKYIASHTVLIEKDEQ